MPKLSGVFDFFKNLDQIPVSDIIRWTRNKGNLSNIQNVMGNRLIYPQTIPTLKEDLEIDLALVREAVFRQPELFYNPTEQKLIIPEEFVKRFPPLINLVISIIETLNPQGITTIHLKSSLGLSLIGSCVAPPYKKGDSQVVSPIINEETLKPLPPGSLVLYPYQDKHLRVKIRVFEGLAPGGELGLIIDLRKWQ